MTSKLQKILWIRELSCGHERYTNLSYMQGIYTKPKVGQNCYCRECWKDVKIVKVVKADNPTTKELQTVLKKAGFKRSKK